MVFSASGADSTPARNERLRMGRPGLVTICKVWGVYKRDCAPVLYNSAREAVASHGGGCADEAASLVRSDTA